MRRAFTLVEVLALGAASLVLLIPLLGLSRRNAATPHDLRDRNLAQMLCLDIVERLKDHIEDPDQPGTPGSILPELDPAKPCDRALEDEIARLAIHPTVERRKVPGRDNLVLLTVSVRWKDRGGRRAEARVARYCYTPN